VLGRHRSTPLIQKLSFALAVKFFYFSLTGIRDPVVESVVKNNQFVSSSLRVQLLQYTGPSLYSCYSTLGPVCAAATAHWAQSVQLLQHTGPNLRSCYSTLGPNCPAVTAHWAQSVQLLQHAGPNLCSWYSTLGPICPAGTAPWAQSVQLVQHTGPILFSWYSTQGPICTAGTAHWDQSVQLWTLRSRFIATSEVLLAVTVKSILSWDVTPCRLVNLLKFRRHSSVL
jgi:hypothetical protein